MKPTPRDPPGEPEAVERAIQKLARERGLEINALRTQYAMERLLYRLSKSPGTREFVLKGAMAFRVLSGDLHRPTQDLDFLGFGDPRPELVAELVRAAIAEEVPSDGLEFEQDSITATEVREAQEYGGVRVVVRGGLGRIPVTVRLDVGFGDAVTPEPVAAAFPALLGHPEAQIRSYPPETMVAEKLEAICRLGRANSRLKDYYDLYYISTHFETNGAILCAAIRNTFVRRSSAIPDGVPVGLTDEFASDPDKQSLWDGFRSRHLVDDAPRLLPELMQQVRDYLELPLAAASGRVDAPSAWTVGEGWS